MQRALILLVEDSDDETLLIRRAFSAAQIRNPIYSVNTGEEAVAYLRGEGMYADREAHPLPFLVLLDLRMPGMDGFEVLEWIRSQAAFDNIRVAVLTSSSELRDVHKAYQLGANTFLEKPLDFENVEALMNMAQVFSFWQQTPAKAA